MSSKKISILYYQNCPKVLKSFVILILVITVSGLSSSGSFKGPVRKNSFDLAAMETIIRNKYDSYATFRWNDYAALMEKLSAPKFKVLPLNEMRKTNSTSKVIVGLRHDIDFNPFKALEMARVEKMYGIRATYFFLATAEYYGSFTESGYIHSPGIETVIQNLSRTGAEIGVHNDLFTVMIKYNQDPFLFNKNELAFYRSLRVRINGTASHGSDIAKKTVPCFQIFSDFARNDSVEYMGKKYPIGKHSLKDFGYDYEAYSVPHNIYISDSGGKWNISNGLEGILKILDSSSPGDRIQILIHPDWWGKNTK